MARSASWAGETRQRVRGRNVFAVLLVITVVSAALAAVGGGLLRAGVPLPHFPLSGAAAAFHAALMIGGVMGTVIGVERAVALKRRAGWSAPALAAASVPAFLLAQPGAGAFLQVAAAAAFVGVNLALVRRQFAAHTLLLLGAAASWLAGNLLLAGGAPIDATLPWWFGFMLVTIAAERLEMTRLTRRHPYATATLVAILGSLGAGAALASVAPAASRVVYGAALVALAAWFVRHDIARRTVHAKGLPRYMAACLLAGYAWLAIGGVAWAAMAAGLPARDAALHALGLGFVGSMVMGHAPVILPAVARVKLSFGWAFYLPLAALHASLLVRLVGGFIDGAWRATGAALNAAALALFVVVAVGAAIAWRRAPPRVAH